MLEAILDLVHRLRDAGVPVSMVEALDATRALGALDLSRRSELRVALAATLVKRADHRPAFDALFDICFPVRTIPAAGPDGVAPSTEALLDEAVDAVRRNDREAMRALAARAVQRFGGIEADRAASARYHLHRVLRRLDLANLLRRTAQDDQDTTGGRSPLADRLARDERVARVEELRRLVAGAIQAELVQVKGAPAAAALSRPTLIEDVDLLTASPAELRRMRLALQPLARRLAARMAQRRRRRHQGRLDVPRTVRRSLSAGGVPLEPAYRRRRVARPDLFVLCDVSGSVAEFARFTLTLLHALAAEFAGVRSFVFVDDVDEVTDRVQPRAARLDLSHLVAGADAVAAHGHSDYGRVFARFRALPAGAAIGPRTTLVITGDARNNDRDPGLDAFRALAARARRVYWLNPEPRARWNTTDSIVAAYAPFCHRMVETRNLRQLAAFVHDVA